MQIYILRNGRETGPFSEETARTLLQQGDFGPDDLGWHEGLPKWLPLSEFVDVTVDEVLEEAVAEPEPVEPVEPDLVKAELTGPVTKEPVAAEPTAPVTTAESSGEPASEKQKACLGYLGIPFTASLTKEKAAFLLNDAMEDPKHAERLSQWNIERLRLFPDLFAAEIQAKKENRASHFFELCQTDGAQYFTDITKAHCQVLVAFLDVKFPQWDVRDPDAAKNYFFPAVAEKFPQLVQKQWRNRLNYNDGPKVGQEMTGKSPTSRLGRRSASPIAAIAKGLVYGLLILGGLYGLTRLVPGGLTRLSAADNAAPPEATPAGPATVVVEKTSPPVEPSAVPSETKKDDAPPAAAATEANPAQPQIASVPPAPPIPSGDPAASPMGMAPSTPPSDPPVPVPGPMATIPTAGTVPLPSSDPVAASLNTAPSAPAFTPAPVLSLKVNLLLTKPVEIQLAYGKMMLPVGTPVKLVARQGALLRVTYRNSVIAIPASSTDVD